jgi:hypothetical protein
LCGGNPLGIDRFGIGQRGSADRSGGEDPDWSLDKLTPVVVDERGGRFHPMTGINGAADDDGVIAAKAHHLFRGDKVGEDSAIA